MKVRDILKITEGRLLSGNIDADIKPSSISTDSRTIKKGEFFIALKGSSFDGSSFIEDAFRKGAMGAMTRGPSPFVKDTKKIIMEVKDTTRALQTIARYHRMNFKLPVICVTGSNGKTTVKEMMWAILSTKYNVLKNEGTKNNHIGVPQALLKLKSEHDICVLELGANHKDEIRLLSGIARPTIAVITNIGPSHLEFFGDLDGVYKAKTEIFEYLDRLGLAVLNGDDKFLSKIRNKNLKIIKFGFSYSNDFMAKILSIEKERLKFIVNDKMEFELKLLGKHNIYNALAAIAVASGFKISYSAMKKALHSYRPTYMRLNLKKVKGISIINDAYNSNPLSMKSALEVIGCYPAKARWVVSGDMLELGKDKVHFHKMIGRHIARSNVQGLLTLGELSKHTLSEAGKAGIDERNLWHCSNHEEIVNILKRIAKKGDTILLKGSRSMKMEEVLKSFKL